jgi:aromatic-L-amino-acid decarboxylase
MSQPTHDNALSMDPEEFRRLGHRVVDWIADYRERAPGLPVRANVRPGDVIAQLPSEPPSEPEGFEAVLADLDRVVVPALSHWQHPRFFGWFPSNSDLAAVLGDFLSTGLGVLGLSWQAAPALTEVEQVAVDWLRQMSGLSAEWRGVIQDTASVCTLLALVCARERHAAGAPLTVYTSQQAHSSVDKAAMLAGFRRENVRRIAVDAELALDPADLARWIESDLAAGLHPCAIVATTGTTTTTAMDPIAACAEIAKQHGLWLHVDAAMAGSGWPGISRGDAQ